MSKPRRAAGPGNGNRSESIVIPEPVHKPPEPFLEGNFRRESDGGLDAREIGAGFKHVARLGGQQLGLGGAAEELLEHLHEQQGFDRAVVAEIEDPHGTVSSRRPAGGGWVGRVLRRRIKEHFHDAIDDIAHVREIAEIPAMVEKREGPVLANGPGKEGRGHVGPAPRTVDGEEPQAGDMQAVI